MADFDFVVIGSGVSGMTFAHKAAEKGKKVLVLEEKDRMGGCLCTMEHEGFWLELGGHTIYSSYSSYIDSMKNAGLEQKFLPRVKQPFKMLTKDGMKPITAVLNYFELFLNGWKLFFMSKEGKTVKQYYSSVLGKGNYDSMFKPMIQAVISQDGSDCQADLLLKKRPKDKTLPRSFTLKGGMNGFIKTVAEMENVTVMTSTGAQSVYFADGIYTVKAGGCEYTSEKLVTACSPMKAAELLSGISPELSGLMRTIPSADVESMGIIIKKEDTAIDTLSFIVAQDAPFTSVVARDIVPDERFRGFAFHFKPGRLSYDEKLETVENVLGVSRYAFVKIEETKHLSPTLALGHEQLIGRINEAVNAVDGLYVVGNWFGGLAIEDCARRSAQEAARAI